MSRRRLLVAYDIADPVRLRRVCTVMEGHGERLQYSVFLCDLSIGERADLETTVTAIMNLAEDSIVEIDLGPTSRPATIRMLGKRRNLPGSGPQIV
jgi:CRISPR-associated protein Cas2